MSFNNSFSLTEQNLVEDTKFISFLLKDVNNIYDKKPHDNHNCQLIKQNWLHHSCKEKRKNINPYCISLYNMYLECYINDKKQNFINDNENN